MLKEMGVSGRIRKRERERRKDGLTKAYEGGKDGSGVKPAG